METTNETSNESRKEIPRTIVKEILRSFREDGETLYSKRIVPAYFEVWLHPSDYSRLQSILDEIVADVRLALDNRLNRLNRPSKLDSIGDALGVRKLPFRKVGDWTVRILEDPIEGRAVPGRVVVINRLAHEDGAALDGTSTRPVARRAESTEPARTPAPAPAAEAFAIFTWDDEGGARRFRMIEPCVVIGRDSAAPGAELLVRGPLDVSRRHCRIERDERSGEYVIQDLSLYGTTVNGVAIAPSVEVEGAKERAPGAAVPLPPGAEIGLAGKIQIRFVPQARP